MCCNGFGYFREEVESEALSIIEIIPRAVPLVHAQNFLVKSFDELLIQFWFGKHPTAGFISTNLTGRFPGTS